MKVLHIITSLKIGGAEQALCNLLEQLVRQSNIQHHVAYFYDGPCRKPIEKLGISTYQIKGLFHHYDPIAYLRLKKFITTLKPDLIHSSLWSANIISRIVAKQCNIPLVCALHGSCYNEGRVRNWLDRITAHHAQKIVAVSSTVYNAYQNHIVKTLRNPIKKTTILNNLSVITNGIDAVSLRTKALANPLSRQECGIPTNAFVIGAVGRLEPIKSYHVLIEAFSLLMNKQQSASPLILCIVGNGSQKPLLNRLTHEHGIASSVIFTGMRVDAYRFYQLFDVFALSSQSEGLSIALLEALSFGLPVVTTHHTMAAHDAIINGSNGFLVAPNDATTLAEALGALYCNKELLTSMGMYNKNLVETKFSLQRTAECYQNIFKATQKTTN